MLVEFRRTGFRYRFGRLAGLLDLCLSIFLDLGGFGRQCLSCILCIRSNLRSLVHGRSQLLLGLRLQKSSVLIGFLSKLGAALVNTDEDRLHPLFGVRDEFPRLALGCGDSSSGLEAVLVCLVPSLYRGFPDADRTGFGTVGDRLGSFPGCRFDVRGPIDSTDRLIVKKGDSALKFLTEVFGLLSLAFSLLNDLFRLGLSQPDDTRRFLLGGQSARLVKIGSVNVGDDLLFGRDGGGDDLFSLSFRVFDDSRCFTLSLRSSEFHFGNHRLPLGFDGAPALLEFGRPVLQVLALLVGRCNELICGLLCLGHENGCGLACSRMLIGV